MERRVAKQLTDVHRTVLAQLLLDMLPAGEFLNFVAAGRWCARKMQELRADVLAGVRNIRDYGIGLPPFDGLTLPTAVAFDPVLRPDALRRHQQLWQIDGPVSCLCCVSARHTLDPIQVLLYENRNPMNLLMLQDSLDFLKDDCCCVELACWESTPGKALPWPLLQRFPRLPHREDMAVDYTLLYLQCKTVGLAMCVWRPSPPPWRLAFPPHRSLSSDDATSTGQF
jgi:hypothetical protein